MPQDNAQVVFRGATGYTAPIGRTGIVVVEDGESQLLLFDEGFLEHRLWQEDGKEFNLVHSYTNPVDTDIEHTLIHRIYQITEDRHTAQHRLWQGDDDDPLTQHSLIGTLKPIRIPDEN